MNDRPDDPDVDLERALVRYMAERRITPPDAPRADREGRRSRCAGTRHRGLHECGGIGGAIADDRPAERGPARPRRPPRRPRSATATPAPTPVPTPEASSTSTTTPSTWARTSSRRSRRSTRSRSRPTSSTRTRAMYAQVVAGQTRLRHHVPDLDRHPGPGRHQQDPAARPVAHPEQGQPRPGVGEPGLRPGQRTLDAVHVVDDRRRLRHREDQGDADQLEGALGRALEGPHRDARRPARGLRGGAHPARATASTPSTTPSSTRRSPCSSSSSRSCGCTASRTQQYMASRRHLDRPRLGLGHLHRSSRRSRRSSSTSPRRAAIRGSDATVILEGAKHPIAANLFINHLLDAQGQRRRTRTTSATWARTRRPSEFINPDILDTPWINPDKAVLDKLQELLDLGADLEKYSTPLDRAEGRHLGCVDAGSGSDRWSCPARSGWRSSSWSRWRSSRRSASGPTTGSGGSCSTRSRSTTTARRSRRRSSRRSRARSTTPG